MQFINPKTETLSITYNDITYSVVYYAPAFTITGTVADTTPNWSVGTTYALGDYAIVPELKRVYRSTLAGNTGTFPPSDTTKWVDYGNINDYAMFATDENIGGTTAFTDGVLEFDFSKCDSIAGVDLAFSYATVYLLDTEGVNYLSDYVAGTTYAIDDAVFYLGKYYVSNSAGNIGNTPSTEPEWTENVIEFERLIDGRDIGCLSFSEYFYTDFSIKTRYILTNLTWLASSVLRIEMDGTSTIGTVAYGLIRDLGVTLIGTELGYESTSKFTTNEYNGFRNIIRYGKVRTLEVDVLYDTSDFDTISQTVDQIIDRNIIWIPTTDDKFVELITLGYIERFKIPLDGFDRTKSHTTIIGVNK